MRSHAGLPTPPLGTRTVHPLAPQTTLHVGGTARFWFTASSLDKLRDAIGWARRASVPISVLSGGSNVFVSDDGFDGLVLQPALRGLTANPDGKQHVLVRAAAGERWDGLVAWAIAQGWQGLETLSGIPGWVGAAPVQNIGAYGAEVSRCIESVEAIDRRTGQPSTFRADACDFGYRTSRFKRDPSHIISAVTFRLRVDGRPNLSHPEILATASHNDSQYPTLFDVRRAVIDIRRKKGMVLPPLMEPNDPDRRNAGSFFVNPIVSRQEATRIRTRAMRVVPQDAHKMPWFDVEGGRVKLSAAWLIDKSGLAKGTRYQNVGLSRRHTLCVVTHPGARASDVEAFAAAVRKHVHDTFGVMLDREPQSLEECVDRASSTRRMRAA